MTVRGRKVWTESLLLVLLREVITVPITVERLSPTPLRQLRLTRYRGGDSLIEAERSQTHSWWVEGPSGGRQRAHSGDRCPRSGLMSLTGLPSRVGCSHRGGATPSKPLWLSSPHPASPGGMPGTWLPNGSRGIFCIRRHTLPEADREKQS